MKGSCVLGLATGSTPEAVYDELARRAFTGRLDTSGIKAFLLDEYTGLPADHEASFTEVIRRQVVERLGLGPEAVLGPNGLASDLESEAKRYDASIAASGGVDLQLLGIGSDGHIGFNEPGSSLGSRTRIKTLNPATVSDNSRFFEGVESRVPKHVLTQGIGTILEARHLILMAWGKAKAHAVAACVEGPITSMVPASALQLHPHTTVVVDEAAAQHLRLSDLYRATYAAKPSWQRI